MKITHILLCLFAILFINTTISCSFGSYIWTTNVLDSRGCCGKYISAGLLSDGKYSVSFFSNGRLRYAQSYINNSTLLWNVMDLDTVGIVGMYTSLAVRNGFRPSIAYYNYDQGCLYIGRRNGDSWSSTWSISLIDGSNNSGIQTSMALAPDGRESVAYFTVVPNGTNTTLKYAHYNSVSWDIYILPAINADSESRLSLAFAPDGQPAIAYHQLMPSQPVYIKREPSMLWTSQIVDSSVSGGKDPSLVFLPDGNPAISYQVEYNPATRTYNDLRYSCYNGMQWLHEDVDFGEGIYSNLGYFSSLKLNRSGNPSIAYYELEKTSARFAYKFENEWRIEVVQLAGLVGPYTTLVYGLDGLPVVFYYDMGWTMLMCGLSTPAQVPEIYIKGNNIIIQDGETTPSLDDHTDFGSTDVFGGTITRIFTIENNGTGQLSLTGNPRVEISGINAIDFTVIIQPDSPIAPGSNTCFHVVFDPSAKSVRNATIIVPNDVAQKDPYDFRICGTGRIVEPEMDVKGNDLIIQNGDTTPSLADNTDFGSLDVSSGTITKTFTIENNGNSPLNLTGTPKVQINGAQSTDFIVIVQPESPVPVGGSTTFEISFDPSAKGIRNASISIVNDDNDENPYTYSIRGTGLPAFEIAIRQIYIAMDGTNDVLIRFEGAIGYSFDMYYSDSPQNDNPTWILAESNITPAVEWRDNGDGRTGNIHPSQVKMRRYRIVGYGTFN